MPRLGKTIKLSGSKDNCHDMAFTNVSATEKRPTKIKYGQVSNEKPNTSLGPRIEDTFIPFYDRPGFTTDNASQQYMNGKMFKIPSTSGPTGGGVMEERDLGA